MLSSTATDLRDRAASASDRLDLNMWLLRVLVLVGGVGFAVLGLLTQRLAAVLGGVGAVSTGTPSSGPRSTGATSTGSPPGSDARIGR